MKKFFAFSVLLLCAAFVLGAEQSKLPPMPAAVSGNAIASLKGGLELFSLMGVGPKKTWDDITNQVYIMHVASGKWTEGRPVPGVAGRLGASAVGAKGVVILMGGYVVDGHGGELTLPDVNVYSPPQSRWYSGKEIPVPVDNAVVGVSHDRYVYLIGGRSTTGPVNNVQVYDAEKDTWNQATPLPGTPVFGHAGGLADDTIVYVDGAAKNAADGPRYIASEECWMGKIDHKNPNKIEWSKLPAHPGSAHYGIAAGGSDKDRKIFFSGGTASPHNFAGVSYDGRPNEVSTVTFAFDLKAGKWDTVSESTPDPREDGRGVLSTPLGLVILGGMAKNQAVTARATLLPRK
jgi:N-acetylneuraminic acid mutarotase